MASNPELTEIVTDLARPFSNDGSQLVDILSLVQKKLGYVPPSTIPFIAEKTQLTRPEIHKAIELSPSLSLKPTGKHTLYICNADNCCMQGGTELMAHAKQQLGINIFQTTQDKKIRLESFQCLGNCSMSPNIMIDGVVHGLVDENSLDKLFTSLLS